MAQKSKTKIYYWLKFDKHFFDNLFIKRLLRNFPGGSEMIVIYIRLMLEAIENDCIIDYEGTFDNYAEELALRLETSEEQINMALAYFVKCGVIQVDDGGNTHYPQAKALLGQETNWNRYKKKQAELEKFQLLSNQVPTEIEIEKDKEKERELDKDIDIESEVEEEIKDSSPANENSLKIISDYFQQEIGILSPNQLEQLSDYITLTKMEVDVVKEAITRAADNSKRSFGYVNSILRNWRQNGILTMVKVEEEQRQFQSRKSKQEEVSEYDTW
ncbi:TPA: DnaD domain protein [Streptococcus agalactiae]|uniref:DnaD domain protein n=1 Tax=Streptococcus agalactiae TaxID=1311 RepID=UPI0002DBF8A4|nr:DnaD domain protein [Streptococcus agalactiae]EPU30750.1 replisome organizer [Streptococcus agalactiae MRI Z1-039]KAA9073847.1 DnaD domain protein [Streptococcus agalactiae]KAA9102816.1 DnaD domain protein [Streptococcus agalactiae]KAF1254114.1 replisome organizer [Streptococcus agalactiae]KLK50290.1 replisome organizer [Streptococcus agalactiae]